MPQAARPTSPKSKNRDRRLSLPQFPPPHPPEVTDRRLKRIRRLRTATLVAVHLLIAIHLAHWLIAGRTVNRFVLSDSMETLENGRLNPGFILFAAAATVTLVGGRWLCGWACHMGALQDACAWLLRRIGIRPKTFRARLLGYVPVAMAIYMFIWPTLRRDLLAPLLAAVWPQALPWIGPHHPFPGFRTSLVSDTLWTGLPSLFVAIPFLFICGCATVYFLGSRGFCRYGCPYGGIFAPLEKLASARIVVDIDACDGCGKCTAACSSGIRVHEEVRAYGRVVSDRCIKTLDCIAACPRDALSFGFTLPGLVKGPPMEKPPKRTVDTTWPEEVVVLAVFTLTFFTARGLYGVIPMFMAIGIAISAAAVAWTAWRTLRRRDVRIAGLQLRRAGSLRPGGILFLALTAAGALLLAHSAVIRLVQIRGTMFDDRVLTTREEVFTSHRTPPSDQTARDAREALRWYNRAASFRRGGGGAGLADTPHIQVRAAWLHLVLGELDSAEGALRRAQEQAGLADPLTADLARIIMLRGDEPAAITHLQGALAQRGDFAESRDLLARFYLTRHDLAAATALYEARLATHPHDAACRAGLGSLFLSVGKPFQAREHLARAVEDDPALPRPRHDLAAATALTGDLPAAITILTRAAEDIPAAAGSFRAHADQLRAAGE